MAGFITNPAVLLQFISRLTSNAPRRHTIDVRNHSKPNQSHV